LFLIFKGLIYLGCFWFYWLKMALGSVLLEILHRPTTGQVLSELFIFAIPLWVAVAIGVLVGWVWKPKWASNLSREMLLDAKQGEEFSATSLSTMIPSLNILKFQLPSCVFRAADDGGIQTDSFSVRRTLNSKCRLVGCCFKFNVFMQDALSYGL